MYDLPDTFDAELFGHRVLETIQFAANAVVFTFEPPAVRSVQYGYSYRLRHTDANRTDYVPVADTSVVALVGASVAPSRVFRRRELILGLTGGQRLHCLDSGDPYESYIVQVDDSEWVG